LAAEIDCLGGLLKAEVKKQEILTKQDLIENLLSLAAHHMTDPVLLSAICRFAKRLFKVDREKMPQGLMESCLKQMHNCVELVPYLGLKKYEEVIKLAEGYQDPNSSAPKEKVISLQHCHDK